SRPSAAWRWRSDSPMPSARVRPSTARWALDPSAPEHEPAVALGEPGLPEAGRPRRLGERDAVDPLQLDPSDARFLGQRDERVDPRVVALGGGERQEASRPAFQERRPLATLA